MLPPDFSSDRILGNRLAKSWLEPRRRFFVLVIARGVPQQRFQSTWDLTRPHGILLDPDICI